MKLIYSLFLPKVVYNPLNRDNGIYLYKLNLEGKLRYISNVISWILYSQFLNILFSKEKKKFQIENILNILNPKKWKLIKWSPSRVS